MTSQAALLVSQLSQGWCWAVSEATAVARPSMTEPDQMAKVPPTRLVIREVEMGTSGDPATH